MATTEPVDFQREVIEASHQQPVLVDFWAPWCGPCRVVGPVVEKLAAEAHGRFTLVKLNTDAQPEWAQAYDVTSIPALKLFKDGKVSSERLGALPEPQLRAWLDVEVPSAAGRGLSRATTLRDAGKLEAALAAAKESLALDPTHTAARVLVAELGLLTGAEGSDSLDDIPDTDPLVDHVNAVRTLGALVHRKDELAALAKDGKTSWKHYARAAAALASGAVEETLGALVDAVAINKELDEGRARIAASALLRAVGETSELAQTYRRRLASAMF